MRVKGPTIGGDGAIGSLISSSNGHQQGRVEPSPILVAAFQIKISWPGKTRFMSEHGRLAGTGFKPDINDVCLFAELG